MADQLIECAKCGESFNLALTHCPHCGVSIYPLEGEENSWGNGVAYQTPRKLTLWGHSAGLLIACGFTAGVVSLLSYMVVNNLFLDQAGEVALWVTISLCVALGSFAGAYLAGRFSRQQFVLHGVLTGGINLGTLLLLLAREFETPLTSPWILPAAALSQLAGYSGARLAVRQMRQELVQDLFAPIQYQAELYDQLLEKVRFDDATAERLIDLERQRDPGASRRAWIENAIQRWERDNR